jgi:microcystin-dependent protein
MPAEPFIGEIFMGGMNFPPRGFASCEGQLLSIAQNTALFSLLGTTFGGDGRITFALPDLRGRVPMGRGSGPGLSLRTLGETGGMETVTLISSQMPAHTHSLQAVSDAGDASAPAGNYLAHTGALDKEYKSGGPVVAMNSSAIGTSGSSQPHNNMPPFLVLNFYIALEGIYPARN